jgi:DNA-binding NarL/FixJ family response regulator
MTDQSDRRSAVLLDRHPLVLEGVQRVLARAGVEVVGKTTSPDQALALLEEREPDLLVTEAELPDDGIDGLECLRRARSRVRDLKAIVLSASDDPSRVAAAFEAGADAYVVKTAHPDDLASAIRQAFGHSVYLSRSRVPMPEAREEPAAEPGGLTPREREILRLAAEGHSNAELAGQLWVTEQTVKFHLSNIYRKLRVSNRTEAARWAQLNGLLAAPPTEG